MFWYDNAPTGQEGFDGDFDRRFAFLQVTNASVDTPVTVHIQIFSSGGTNLVEGECAPADILNCRETNFFDFFTAQDTNLYNLEDLHSNEPSNPDEVGVDLNGTKGLVVITPIDGIGTGNAISHQHMFGTTRILDIGPGFSAFRINAVGRDAVSFSNGAIVPDGTELDGVDNGYVLLQPEFMYINWIDWNDLTFGFFDGSMDIVSIAFIDDYVGPFGGYSAVPGAVLWTSLQFDANEQPISCGSIPQNCFFDIGINEDVPATDFFIGGGAICPSLGAVDGFGFTKVGVSGYDGLENELGLNAANVNDKFIGTSIGGASWMFAE